MIDFEDAQFEIDKAQFYDETTKFTRFLLSIKYLNWRWIITPFCAYETWLRTEEDLKEASDIRKRNTEIFFKSRVN